MNIILAIAGDHSVRESLGAALPKKDLLLFEASIESALRRLVTIQVDVLVLDDGPGLGFPALKTLCASFPDIPIVVLSAISDTETLASYALAGARQCVLKPFEIETLNSIVASCMTPVQVRGTDRRTPVRTKTDSLMQHQMALRWMSRNTAHSQNPAKLAQSLVDGAQDIFGATCACVLYQSKGVVRVSASQGVPDSITSQIRLSFTDGLMRRLDLHPSLFDPELHDLEHEAAKELAALSGVLALPLMGCGQACGVFVIGEKAAGAPYSEDERDLLTVMARFVSSCLEKAKTYRDTARQQERLDAVLANIQAGVITVQSDKTISMMNESAQRILQIHAEDVLGRSVQKLGSPFADVVLRTLAEGAPRLREEIYDAAVKARLGLSATPLGSEGVVIIFTRLHDTEVPQQDVGYSPIWEYLASRVAQEIKNPMVAINTFAQLLPRDYASQEFRTEFSAVVQEEISRINGVVDTLYAFARHPRLTLSDQSLAGPIREVLELFKSELEARSIKVETSFEGPGLEARIDPGMFSKALENVIQNSIEAMPDGGTLSVDAQRDNGSCKITITDTGGGVSEQDAALIFMPFFSTKEKGMGMGLTMAHRIMEQHEGHLELVGGKGKGGAFTLRVPCAPEQ